ncbi:MAG TPA: phosphate-starvation-inducible PsiE family protein [Spirochaetota bacterium]|nr:phosphate-starvation-inducible PsiE family protein [Spirochaetota bacterium]HSA15156.1 phosphate-starvation-inducible PsiE family protein [Spirochaetota bacterium]
MNWKKIIDVLFLFAENSIYLLIGVILTVASYFIIYNIAVEMVHFSFDSGIIRSVVEILDQTLLVLMLIEILYTIRVSLKEHVLKPEPFLIVAVIAAVRRILIISVEVAHVPERFNQFMIEISVLGVLIFVFIAGMMIMKKMKNEA